MALTNLEASEVRDRLIRKLFTGQMSSTTPNTSAITVSLAMLRPIITKGEPSFASPVLSTAC